MGGVEGQQLGEMSGFWEQCGAESHTHGGP